LSETANKEMLLGLHSGIDGMLLGGHLTRIMREGWRA